MSGTVSLNFWAAFGSVRVTADARMVGMMPEREAVEASSIEETFNQVLAGVGKVPGELTGRVNGNAQRAMIEELAAHAGGVPYIVHPPGTAEGSPSFFIVGDIFSFGWEGQRGALYAWKAKLEASSQLYPGFALAGWPGQAAVTADGSTDGFEVAALGAGEKLVWVIAALNPPGVVGTNPTLDVDLESDVDDTWASAAVVASATQLVAPGYQVIEIDGDTDPISDTFFRLTYDIGGTDSPAFQVISALAIVTK